MTCQSCGLSYKDHLMSGAAHAFQGYASESEIKAAQRELRPPPGRVVTGRVSVPGGRLA